jgi:voltage-gated potassium channel
MNHPNRQFIISIILFLVTVAVGFAGYRIAGWSSLDALYMVVITIFGVGYGEVGEMSPELRVFTLVLILVGCTSLIYAVGAFINYLTEGQLKQLLGKRKMDKEISQLRDHTIICGYGRVGKILAEKLKSAKKPFVIVDPEDAQVRAIEDTDYLHIQGDATSESVLEKAGIRSASALATVIPNDAINVFIVLSARGMNPTLTIIARANEVSSEEKLKQAGADKVVLPAVIGADRIAHMVLRPNAQDVIEKDLQDNAFINGLNDMGLVMDEIKIEPNSPIAGHSLEKLETAAKSAFIVVAVRKGDNETILKPPLDLQIEAGDTLIIMSHEGVVQKFVIQKLKRRVTHYRGAKVN